jgi:hypothetical protein
VDQPGRRLVVEGTEGDGGVPEDLGVDAAEADQEQDAEGGVAPAADDQLDAGRDRRLLFDHDRGRRQPIAEVRHRRRQRRLVFDAEHDAAGVGFVAEAERLGDEGVTQAAGVRLLAGGDQPAGDDRQTLRFEERPRRPVVVGGDRGERGGRGAWSRRQVPPADRAGEGLDGVLGRGEDGDAAPTEGVAGRCLGMHRLDQQGPIVSVAGVGHQRGRRELAAAQIVRLTL